MSAAYTIDCPEAAFRNLADLIDVLAYLRVEGPFAEGTHFDSLLWIARDLADGIREHKNEEAAKAMASVKAGREAAPN